MNFYILTPREGYSVNERGHIGRPSIKMPPSAAWQFRGLVRISPFGSIVERMYFDNADSFAARLRTMRPDEWRFKNGKGRWRIIDCDHGTNRQMGVEVLGMGIAP